MYIYIYIYIYSYVYIYIYSLSEIALSGASKLASAYFTLFYRSVHVLYTGIYRMNIYACIINI